MTAAELISRVYKGRMEEGACLKLTPLPLFFILVCNFISLYSFVPHHLVHGEAISSLAPAHVFLHLIY